MATVLCIQVSSSVQTQKTELEIHHANEWSPDEEQRLLQQIKEVFSLVRTQASELRLQIELTVTDPAEVIFQLKKKLNHLENAAQKHKLSLREMEILGLIMQGLTNQQISEKLFISFETVRTHRKNILEKTGSKNTAALISYYHQTFFDK